jgi:hypothetical protein
MKRHLVALVATGISALSATASGAAMIDLSSYVNSNVSTYAGGSGYPAPGQTTIGGITFSLAGYQGGTGVDNPTGNTSKTIAIGETGIDFVYLIVNSAFGSSGATVGAITFTGNGTSSIIDLVEGINVRDHYCCGGYNQTASSIFATADYTGGAHFDVYRYALAPELAQSLDSITFAGINSGNPQGEPFLAAITTAAAVVPEPATWAMLVGGFGLVGGALRVGRRTARYA